MYSCTQLIPTTQSQVPIEDIFQYLILEMVEFQCQNTPDKGIDAFRRIIRVFKSILLTGSVKFANIDKMV